MGAGAAGAEDHPPKSSLLNKSAGMAAAGFEAGTGAALGAGGEAGVAWCVKEKSSVFFACGAAAGFGAGGLVGVASKKLPPLRGGGEETGAVEGVDFLGMAVGKLVSPENADGGDCAGGFDALEFEKLSPPKASAKPPNASFCCGGGEAMPPKEGCRSCVG